MCSLNIKFKNNCRTFKIPTGKEYFDNLHYFPYLKNLTPTGLAWQRVVGKVIEYIVLI